MIVGFEVLEKWKLHPLGPQQARDYLKEHMTMPNIEAVPAMWWTEFEQLSSEATAPKVVVKTEVEAGGRFGANQRCRPQRFSEGRG